MSLCIHVTLTCTVSRLGVFVLQLRQICSLFSCYGKVCYIEKRPEPGDDLMLYSNLPVKFCFIVYHLLEDHLEKKVHFSSFLIRFFCHGTTCFCSFVEVKHRSHVEGFLKFCLDFQPNHKNQTHWWANHRIKFSIVSLRKHLVCWNLKKKRSCKVVPVIQAYNFFTWLWCRRPNRKRRVTETNSWQSVPSSILYQWVLFNGSRFLIW